MSPTSPTPAPRGPGERRASSPERRAPLRVWLVAIGVALALSIVPVAALLIVPARSTFAPPSAESSAPRDQENVPAHAEVRAPRAPLKHPSVPSSSTEIVFGGAVVDAEGRFVAGASVTCAGGEAETTTDEEGRFAFDASVVSCDAVARHDGELASAKTSLRRGGDNTLRLRAYGAIEGSFVDDRGAPIPSFEIAVESFVAADSSLRADVPPARFDDASGSFALEKLAPGRYVLAASSRGRAPARSDPIDVESGRRERVTIRAETPAKLTGRVTEESSGAPIAGAVVALDAPGVAVDVSSTRTDESGSFSLDGVPPSDPFSIRVEHEGHRTKIVPAIVARGGSAHVDVELTPRGDGGSGYELEGIGAMLVQRGANVVIAGVVPKGPSDRGGLARGDRVVAIDGASTEGVSLADCIQRLRGRIGTRVSVAVERDDGRHELILTRDKITP